MSRFLDIRLADIRVGDRLRQIDPDWVDAIAMSMEKLGQQNPVLVAKSSDHFKLVAGAHRLAAVKKLKWEKITAVVVDGTNLELRLHEIDENLLRRELSELDRAAFLLERKTVWEELHPETAKGKAGAAARWMQATSLSFASEAAEKLHLSVRSVQRAIKRMKIDAGVRAEIAGTYIADNGSILDSLARLTPSEQRKVVKLMLRDKDPIKSVGAALGKKPAADKDKPLNALIALWRKTPASVKRAFVKAHTAEIAELLDGKASR